MLIFVETHKIIFSHKYFLARNLFLTDLLIKELEEEKRQKKVTKFYFTLKIKIYLAHAASIQK